MKRLLLGLSAIVLVGGAIAWSQKDARRPTLDILSEERNPWTHLKLNNAPDDFQFAVIADRTGGHRPHVFSRAVEQINLMQPELVMSVGDLIEGYTRDKKEIARQWRQFQGYTSRLQMPFFYVVGNHDNMNKETADLWKEKFGRTYYEFVYRDVLFLALDSEDPPGKSEPSIGAAQLAWLRKVLKDNDKVRWTFVFLHKPFWFYPNYEKLGWSEVEKLLKGRNYSVFAGHLHQYNKAVRQGMNYYTLATTGGDSRMRGVDTYKEFDHITWVTMKKNGPVVANILLDGVLREDLAPINGSDEEGVAELYRRPVYPVVVHAVYKDGTPIVGARVALVGIGKERGQPYADGFSEADGRVRFSTYRAFDGAPANEYAVLIELRRPHFNPDGTRGKDYFDGRYASPAKSPFQVLLKPAENKFRLVVPVDPPARTKEAK